MIKSQLTSQRLVANIIKSIAQDSSILTGSFDPLGSNFDTNKNLYFEMILSLSNSLKDC